MKQTRNKLKSNSGATIIIALLFMLICVFVGGSVLVAATVNGGRLENERADQQSVLNQRSVAAVIADELSTDGIIDLRFQLSTSGTKTVVLGDAASTTTGVRRAIFDSTDYAYRNLYSHQKKFTVSFKDSASKDVEIKCTVTTEIDNGYIENYIRFDDDPKLMIVLKAIEGSDSVSWYSMKVEKGGGA